MPAMRPGEKVLLRIVGGGRDMHPFHHHGNHARVIAKDGRLLESAPGLGADLSYEGFTIQSVPGETGGAWGGTPVLGILEPLPPGEGGLNPFGGLAFMWHSHTEKEMTNYDIFP